MDAALVAQSLLEGLADHDADVFDGVMRIDLQIALGLHVQIDQAVARKQIEHVIEKPDARVRRGFSRPIKIERNANLGFTRLAGDFGFSVGHRGHLRFAICNLQFAIKDDRRRYICNRKSQIANVFMPQPAPPAL
jgi:hypothetical protein